MHDTEQHLLLVPHSFCQPQITTQREGLQDLPSSMHKSWTCSFHNLIYVQSAALLMSIVLYVSAELLCVAFPGGYENIMFLFHDNM